MKLVEEKKLSVSDNLSVFFSAVPADKKDITIHQLLTHSAGFPPVLGDDYDNITAVQFTALAFQTPLNFSPGTEYDYSNVGYSLLGILLEKVSGMNYEAFLHKKLFEPAGMLRTGYNLPRFTKDELAVGYRDNIRWGTAIDRPWLADGPGWHLRGNGGMLSTVGDMYKWYLALKNNTVLSRSQTNLMFTKHIAENPKAISHYGYGWVLQDFGGKKFIWHNGGNGVYNAFMAFAQEEDFCVIVSSNTNNIISDKVGIALFRIFSGKQIDSLPQAIMREEEPYRNNSVTLAVINSIHEKGSDYFGAHYHEVLKEAGFDFENDMQLLGAGELLMENNETEKALQLFTVYTKLFPRIVVAWNRLGRCYLKLNNKEKAKACFKQSVNIRSTDNPAVQLLEDLN
jgi:CubicO group peptidase (beta-lactamase class C family)